MDADDGAGRVREAYGDETYRRLAEVKARDPDNVFHGNKNIPPGKAATGSGMYARNRDASAP